MKEKKLGRVFKVGDKVKLTKAGEECGFFATEFREGDNAEVMELNKFDGSIYRVMVTSGEAKGYRQTSGSSAGAKSWFEHIDDKKTRKKQRKYFRMGDFVALKDGILTEMVTTSSDFEVGMVGVISGEACDGVVTVRFINGEQSDVDFIEASALRLATKEERKSLRKHKIAKITYDSPCDNASEQTTEKETEIPPEYNVKIGDYVKITENADGHPVGTVGFVIEIEEVPEGYYNHVVVSDFDDNCWNEHNVKLVHRASLTCEDEDSSESNSTVTPATEEEKMVMLGDNLVNCHTKSVCTVIRIDDTYETVLPYYVIFESERTWISDGTVVQDYGKLLEDGRVYDWATDTTFANVESWINSAK